MHFKISFSIVYVEFLNRVRMKRYPDTLLSKILYNLLFPEWDSLIKRNSKFVCYSFGLPCYTSQMHMVGSLLEEGGEVTTTRNAIGKFRENVKWDVMCVGGADKGYPLFAWKRKNLPECRYSNLVLPTNMRNPQSMFLIARPHAKHNCKSLKRWYRQSVFGNWDLSIWQFLRDLTENRIPL